MHTEIQDIISQSHTHDLHTVIRFQGGDRSVMVVVIGNGHGDTSSNSGRD